MDNSSKMDRLMVVRQDEDRKVIKLLLLGTGESGKSTIFKQMQILYVEEGFSDYEKSTFRHVVRRNVVESTQTLLFGCEKFQVPFKNPNSEKAAKFMASLDPLAADFLGGRNRAAREAPVEQRARHQTSVRATRVAAAARQHRLFL